MMSFSSEDKIELQADPICSSANAYEPNASGVLLVNQWYNVGITYNQSITELYYYINGVVIDSFNVALNVQNTTYDLLIGNHVAYPYTMSSTGANFQGKIDDIRIYNRLLKSCDMDSLFHLPNPNTTAINNISSHSVISIFPNPATQNISIRNAGKIARIEMYNAMGQLVKSISGVQHSIDVSDLDKGFYFIKVEGTTTYCPKITDYTALSIHIAPISYN
jgi:hypothetical protein